MTVQLSPELEALVMKDVERGPYRSIDDFVEQAVTMLHERGEYLAANRDRIRLAIEEGWAESERGELIEGEQVKRDLAAMKAEWLAERKGA
jgi:Arc/MetJ-type ribon-helix-helix transcriptional regulator